MMRFFLLLGLCLLSSCAEMPCGQAEQDTACKIITGAFQVGFGLLGGL